MYDEHPRPFYVGVLLSRGGGISRDVGWVFYSANIDNTK